MNLTVRTYQSADQFLARTQRILEQAEALNNLILGVTLQLQKSSLDGKSCYLATVDRDEVLVLAAVMTPPANLIVHAETKDNNAIKVLCEYLLQSEWPIPGVIGTTEAVNAFASIWTASTGKLSHLAMQMCLYELRRVIQPPAIEGYLRLATMDDLSCLTEWKYSMSAETSDAASLEVANEIVKRKIGEGSFYVWAVGNEIVSMAAKRPATTHGIVINLVYTPPEKRKHGYASACVGALSQLLLESGYQFCALFTDLTNPISNSIYQKIGYIALANLSVYQFSPE